MGGSLFHRHRGSIDEPFWVFRLRCAQPQAAGVSRVIDRIAFTLNDRNFWPRVIHLIVNRVSTPNIALVCLRRCEQIGDHSAGSSICRKGPSLAARALPPRAPSFLLSQSRPPVFVERQTGNFERSPNYRGSDERHRWLARLETGYIEFAESDLVSQIVDRPAQKPARRFALGGRDCQTELLTPANLSGH
jgi:hypothetical protein